MNQCEHVFTQSTIYGWNSPPQHMVKASSLDGKGLGKLMKDRSLSLAFSHYFQVQNSSACVFWAFMLGDFSEAANGPR